VDRFVGFVVSVLLPTSTLFISGCSNSSGDKAAGIEVVSQDANYFDASAANNDVTTRLEHDFGLLRPGEKVRHRFDIPNDSDQDWTFKKFHINCICTVGHVSGPQVAARDTGWVDLEYRAPSSNSDDQRAIQIEFDESSVPPISLRVKARIRQPVTVTPAELNLSRVGRGQIEERFFEVHNFSEHDWTTISASAKAPWLSVTTTSVPAGEDRLEPRQIWRVVVRARTDKLPSGRHEGQVHVKPVSDDSLESLAVPVMLVVASPVDAIPGSMFFGTVHPGESSTRKVLLSFASTSARAAAESIRLEHDLGYALDLSCAVNSDRFLELSGVLSPSAPRGIVQGRIIISFGQQTLPRLEIPVTARVENGS